MNLDDGQRQTERWPDVEGGEAVLLAGIISGTLIFVIVLIALVIGVVVALAKRISRRDR
jgi:hypothetical protein